MTWSFSFPIFLTTISSFCAVSWSLPVDSDACQASNNPTSTCGVPFKFAVLGDSWASGVSYNLKTEYDGNAGRCFRNTEAYGVQMKNDITWAGSNIYFDFPACSGSHMVDIAGGDRCQLCTLENPDLLIITIGGNDVGFFDVIDSCVYHSISGKDYGPGYENDPDRKGACAKAIDEAMGRIQSSDTDGLTAQLTRVYEKFLDSDQAKSNPELRIYQTGYVHFFNIDIGSDWCSSHSFWPYLGVYLSHAVRADINELVDQGNKVIRSVTSSFASKHVGYVSITEGFNGHRFCEADHSYIDQYLSPNVWLWNAVPQIFPTEQEGQPGADGGRGPEPWPSQLFNSTSGGDSGQGSTLRPFHPKEPGFTAMKEAIINQLRRDKVPGVRG